MSLASYICVILTSSAGFEIPAFIEMTKRSHALIDRRWVPAWTASVASTLLSLPVSIAGSILFAAPIYYMVGYADTSARFAFFWLITLLVDVVSSLHAVVRIQRRAAGGALTCCHIAHHLLAGRHRDDALVGCIPPAA